MRVIRIKHPRVNTINGVREHEMEIAAVSKKKATPPKTIGGVAYSKAKIRDGSSKKGTVFDRTGRKLLEKKAAASHAALHGPGGIAEQAIHHADALKQHTEKKEAIAAVPAKQRTAEQKAAFKEATGHILHHTNKLKGLQAEAAKHESIIAAHEEVRHQLGENAKRITNNGNSSRSGSRYAAMHMKAAMPNKPASGKTDRDNEIEAKKALTAARVKFGPGHTRAKGVLQAAVEEHVAHSKEHDKLVKKRARVKSEAKKAELDKAIARSSKTLDKLGGKVAKARARHDKAYEPIRRAEESHHLAKSLSDMRNGSYRYGHPLRNGSWSNSAKTRASYRKGLKAIHGTPAAGKLINRVISQRGLRSEEDVRREHQERARKRRTDRKERKFIGPKQPQQA